MDADRNPPVFDPATSTAPIPESFKQSYQAWMDAEYWRLQIPEALGGTPAPSSLNWADRRAGARRQRAGLDVRRGPGFAGVVHRNGNERDQRIAEIMVEREWGATMVLTEPDAGSDVGAGRSQGHPQRRRLLEHRGRQALHHLGRARHEREHRPPGARPSRRASRASAAPAPRACSLFIVPKLHFDLETGELTGERNGAYVTNVEHKMGIKVSNTCEITFGDSAIGGGEPARAGCSARCTTASRRCSRSSRTPG